MATRMKQWRSSSARRLSSVFGLSAMLEEDENDGVDSFEAFTSTLPVPAHPKHSSAAAATTTTTRATSKRGKRRSPRQSKNDQPAASSSSSSPKVPPLSWKLPQAHEPPLSPRSASSPACFAKPPGYRGHRKFSLPQLEVTSSPHDDGLTSSASMPASPRRLLQSLSASLRALRVYARTTSGDEFGEADDDPSSLRRCGSHIESSSAAAERKFPNSRRGGSERRAPKKLSATSPSVSPSSLASFITANSPSSPSSSVVRSRSSSSSSSSSSTSAALSPRSSADRTLGRVLDQVSTTEGYELLTEALGIKIVYHRFKKPVYNNKKTVRQPTAKAAASGGGLIDGSSDDISVLAVSAEHLLRKYFAVEQEEKRLQQLRKEEAEGDDISLIALPAVELTFDGLLDRVAALHPPLLDASQESAREVDQDIDQVVDKSRDYRDLEVFYDDAEGSRVAVLDTASLLYVVRDWRHRQQQTRREAQEEARRERRERWRRKMEQIEQNERGRKKEMLTKIGNMKFMLKSRNPPASAKNESDCGKSESEGDASPEEREKNESESRRREKMRGVSLKLHIYEQRPRQK
ncbi:uncharacterized protein ACA1_064890 [Acanthamoeba castellanii str. Neff]|uniref:Uncharacterized protein n=1 Tax=Acanthamoeba castellanii (strain ATCC 30010 / Neff) TaxID=1257118 RepID=L8GXN6_ACACF|nr:uncharacterized protein ACA1_064890 [Acanthamoeba castellanii str. Neff]ELR17702.1 hypothetical protein ACA1_064890 [Acanthamoeba castellanii str. Neff]